MIQDCLEVEVGFMTAGKTLEVDVGQGAASRLPCGWYRGLLCFSGKAPMMT
jgi:hypothetical protein